MNDIKKFEYIYGPVHSWRMGMSLGIDPITTNHKVCNMDCVYCQLGRTVKFEIERQIFVSVEAMMAEIETFPIEDIDYYTLCGRGEPTLAKNLGSMIRALHQAGRRKIAVITNSILLGDPEVQEDLALADLVLAKLDAADQASLDQVDIPAIGTQLEDIVASIQSFKKYFSGKLALQMMFIEENQHCAPAMAALARAIAPDEIQINTPLRPSGVTPLDEESLAIVQQYFKDLPAVSVYDMAKKPYVPLDDKQTIRRHGNFKK